jgi:hypothetical protein
MPGFSNCILFGCPPPFIALCRGEVKRRSPSVLSPFFGCKPFKILGCLPSRHLFCGINLLVDRSLFVPGEHLFIRFRYSLGTAAQTVRRGGLEAVEGGKWRIDAA